LLTAEFAESETLYPPLESVIATFVAFAGVARHRVDVAVVVPALEKSELFVTTLNQYEVPAVRGIVVEVEAVVVYNVVGLEVVP
jgi:hypothetical protein